MTDVEKQRWILAGKICLAVGGVILAELAPEKLPKVLNMMSSLQVKN